MKGIRGEWGGQHIIYYRKRVAYTVRVLYILSVTLEADMSTLTTADILTQLDRLAVEARSLAIDHELTSYTLDEDGWIQSADPAYSDPAEVIAVQAQQLANVRHALRAGSITDAQRADLTSEHAALLRSISAELALLEMVQ